MISSGALKHFLVKNTIILQEIEGHTFRGEMSYCSVNKLYFWGEMSYFSVKKSYFWGEISYFSTGTKN